jgi:hypothetical protein
MASPGDLEPLVGDWDVVMTFPNDAFETMRGTTSFSWLLGGQFLMQRAGADHPAAPELLAVIAPWEEGFRQHYFDSRGVVRCYEMTFVDSVWSLWRDAELPDFSQAFEARMSDDGTTMTGWWRRVENGAWVHDFDLVYTRRS